MRYRPLGRTGIVVSEFCLGAMMLGEWGNTDESECHRMVHRALDAGINFIDTADEYAFGGSEEIVGRALKGRRDDVVLATKFNHQMRPGLNTMGNSRRWIMTAVEDSLRRLGTDYIDLYQAHRPDPDTDIDETLGALSDLVHQGKVRAIGTSAFPAEQLVEAQWVSERRGARALRHRAAVLFDPCPGGRGGDPADSGALRDRRARLQPAERRLAGGQVPARRAGRRRTRARRATPRTSITATRRSPSASSTLVEQLEAVAKEAGLSLLQLALGFVVAHRAVTSAIIGPRTHEQLEEQLAAADVTLTTRRARPYRRARTAWKEHQSGRRRVDAAVGSRPRPSPARRSIVIPMAHNGVGVSDFVKERLLQIRGDLRIFKDLDPAKTALVAIDMQNAFLEPGGPIPVPSALEIVEPINRAAQGCRELGVPVIWIRSHHPTNGGDWRHFFDHFVRPERREAAAAHLSADAHGSQFYSEMDVQDSDFIVIKNRYSCFVPGRRAWSVCCGAWAATRSSSAGRRRTSASSPRRATG